MEKDLRVDHETPGRRWKSYSGLFRTALHSFLLWQKEEPKMISRMVGVKSAM